MPDSEESREVDRLIEMWKQTVTVQQHFNDLGWRIRGLALTALTFALGAAAVAAKDETIVALHAGTIPLAAALVSVGLVLWLAFWFVDDIWYHSLLRGAGRHAEELEAAIRPFVPAAGLSRAISKASHLTVKFPGTKWTRELKSADKLRFFYGTVALLLLLLLFALSFG